MRTTFTGRPGRAAAIATACAVAASGLAAVALTSSGAGAAIPGSWATEDSAFFTKRVEAAATPSTNWRTTNIICQSNSPTRSPLWTRGDVLGLGTWADQPGSLPAPHATNKIQAVSGANAVVVDGAATYGGTPGATTAAINSSISGSSTASPYTVYMRGYFRLGTIVVDRPDVRIVGVTNAGGALPVIEPTSPGTAASGALTGLRVDSNGRNFRLSNVTMQNYGSNSTKETSGDVYTVDTLAAKDAVVQRSSFLNSQGSALRLGSYGTAIYNCFQGNGRQGLSIYKSYDVSVENNEFKGNGMAYTSDPAGQAGAMKVWASALIYMGHNFSHGNIGPGIWFDNNNAGVEIAENYVSNNTFAGIMYETSYDANIHHNTVVANNTNRRIVVGGTSQTEAGIYISNSGGAGLATGANGVAAPDAVLAVGREGGVTGINVDSNDIKDNHFGITLFQDPKRYCGSSGEESLDWCTLTGGKLSTTPFLATPKTVAYPIAEPSPGTFTIWEPISSNVTAEVWRPGGTGGTNSTWVQTCRAQDAWNDAAQTTVDTAARLTLRDKCYWTTKNVRVRTNTFHNSTAAGAGNRNAIVALPTCWAQQGVSTTCFAGSRNYAVATPSSPPLYRSNPFKQAGDTYGNGAWWATQMLTVSGTTRATQLGLTWGANQTGSSTWSTSYGLWGSATTIASNLVIPNP